ncbi:MAG: SEC-C metal-binding domain-containing protein [Friedmanniella sp.]
MQVGSRAGGAGVNGAAANGSGDSHGPLIESGPDPDDFGVAVHAVDGEDVPEAAEDLVVAESEPISSRPQVRAKGLNGQRSAALTYTAPDEDGSVKTAGASPVQTDEYAGVGRNAPCPCGSGKKFKLCHGRAGG